jgi:hypothetical protein
MACYSSGEPLHSFLARQGRLKGWGESPSGNNGIVGSPADLMNCGEPLQEYPDISIT